MAAMPQYLPLFLLALTFPLAFSATCPCSDVSLCKPITTPPRQERYMFSKKKDVWKKYDWSKVTTVAVFRDWDPELFCYAHSKGVRVVGWGAFPVDKLNDTDARTEWINSKTKEAVDNFADGFNIDIEQNIKAGSPEVDLLTQLAKDMADAFHKLIPSSQVTFDVPFSPNCTYGRCYDAKGLAEALDFLVIMAYDEPATRPGIACGCSPFNQTASGVEEYLKLGISPDKLVLGLPWYGYDFKCASFAKDVCTVDEVSFGRERSVNSGTSQVEYASIQDLLISRAVDGRQWGPLQLLPFFHYQDTTGAMHQVWYDDPQSLSVKYALATDWAKLRGIAVWNADHLDYSDIPRAKQQTEAMWAALPPL